MPPNSLTLDEVRKVAQLSRLALTDSQLEAYRHQLGAIIQHIEQLRTLDLSGVEPMTSPIEMVNRLGADEPGPMLSNEDLMKMAPDGSAEPPFIRVPRVIGGGEGA